MNTKTITSTKTTKSVVDPFAEFDQPVTKAKAVKTTALKTKAPVAKVAPKAPKTVAKSSVKIVEKPAKAIKAKVSKSSAGSFQVGIIIRGEAGTKSKFTVLEAKDGYAAITVAPDSTKPCPCRPQSAKSTGRPQFARRVPRHPLLMQV